MKTALLGLLAETSIHPGSGRGMGVVDLPVAREAATDYPVIVGSSLKGALRDKMVRADVDAPDERFGVQEKAGDLLVSDARLLLLPVRSLTGSYRWVTCPHVVERYRRDLGRAGLQPRPTIPHIDPHTVHTVRSAGGKDHLFLEERQFRIQDVPVDDLVRAIEPLVSHDETRSRLPDQLAVVHDDDFAWFARYGLSVQARNFLDRNTKMSKNLWYEETLPPDTLMYAIVAGRSDESIGSLDALFPSNDRYLQVGGNETVGQGWFDVSVRKSGSEVGQ